MKTSTLLLVIGALIIGGIIGFSIGKAQSGTGPDQPIAVNDTPGDPAAIDKQETLENESPADTVATPEEANETPKEEPPEETATNRNNNQTLPSSEKCFTEEKKLSLNLTLFSEKLESMNLEYDNQDPSRLQDCSGIFHRIVQHVAKSCDQYKYPDYKKTRASRALAKWYHDNGNLVIVEDPMKSRNLIKPGSVLFFGGSGKNYQNMTIDQLCCAAPKGIIEHIGTVTEVTRDDQGNIEGYVMMHGRRPGKAAERSHYHNINPPRIGFPVLGNWEQQWVAVANIMTPK